MTLWLISVCLPLTFYLTISPSVKISAWNMASITVFSIEESRETENSYFCDIRRDTASRKEKANYYNLRLINMGAFVLLFLWTITTNTYHRFIYKVSVRELFNSSLGSTFILLTLSHNLVFCTWPCCSHHRFYLLNLTVFFFCCSAIKKDKGDVCIRWRHLHSKVISLHCVWKDFLKMMVEEVVDGTCGRLFLLKSSESFFVD